MFKKAFIIISIVLIIIISLVASGVFYVMQDIRYYSERALKPLEEKTGFRICFDDVSWQPSLGLGVTVKNLKVTHVASNTTVLASDKNYIHLQLLPLLRKNIVISKIIIDTPRICMFRNQDGTWPFTFSPPNSPLADNDARSSWLPSSIALRRCVINNGEVMFQDRLLNTQLQFRKLNLDIARQLFVNRHRLSFSAEQLIGDAAAHISLTGSFNTKPAGELFEGIQAHGTLNLQNIDLSAFSPYCKQWLSSFYPEGLLDAHLECNLNPGLIFSAGGWIKSESLTLHNVFEAPVTIRQILCKGDAAVSQGAIELKNAELSLPDIAVKGNLTVAGLPQAPIIDAQISTNSITWKTVKQTLPASVLRQFYPDVINKIADGAVELRNLHLKTGTSVAHTATLELLDGKGELSNVKVNFKDPLPQLKLASGLFSFTKEKLTLTNITAQWFPNDAHIINGAITQPFTSPVFDISALSTTPADALKATLVSLFPESSPHIEKWISLGTGIVKISTQINYPVAATKQAELLSTIDLSQLNYTLGQFFGKPFGLQNMVTIKTMFAPNTFPVAADWSYELNNKSLLLSGSLENLETPAFKAAYQLKDLDITSLDLLFLPPDLKMQAILNGSGTITVPLYQPASPDIRGDITASRFEMSRTGDNLSLVSLNAQGAFNGDRLHLANGAGTWGKTSVTCSGDFLYGKNPLGQFNADVSYLDLDDFIETVIKFKHMFSTKNVPATPTVASPPGEKSFFRRVVINIPAHVHEGKFMSWHFTDGTTNISIKDGVMTYGDINLHAYQGIVNGTVIHDFSQPDIYRLTFIPAATGIEFEEFLPELKENNVIAGKIDIDGMYTSLFKRDFEIVPHMEGQFKIKMKDAKLGKFTVVSKIFSLLNFTEMIKLKMPDMLSQGMPIDTITGQFAMKSGVAHTEDLFLKSPAMNLSAVGDIIFPRKEIDLIVGVQPLETIGKILGSIPIAGKILTGENKSITVSYFQISGPYKDAAVKPIPVESLSRGVITIFKRFYNLPQEIFNPGYKKDKGSAN